MLNCYYLGEGSLFHSAIPTKGYSDWKHVMETNKGFHKHVTSKEHLASKTMWRKRGSCTKQVELYPLKYRSNKRKVL